MADAEVMRQSLTEWIVQHNENVDVQLDSQTSNTLIQQRLLTSLQIAELLLYIESLRGTPVDPQSLRAGAFQNIDSIVATFFPEYSA